MRYEDLNPMPASIRLNGHDYEMRAFDLNAQVWADFEFANTEKKGLEVLSERLRRFDAQASLKLCWHLLDKKGQRHLGGFDNFVKLCGKEGDTDWDMIVEIYKKLLIVIGVSQPMLEDVKRDLELKKSSASAAGKP